MLGFSERPLGTYQVLHTNSPSQVKELDVKAGTCVSYQTYKKLVEHWYITQGPALVTIDGATQNIHISEAVVIDVGVEHRIADPDTNSVTFIEVQTGACLGEDGIARLEDDFGQS